MAKKKHKLIGKRFMLKRESWTPDMSVEVTVTMVSEYGHYFKTSYNNQIVFKYDGFVSKKREDDRYYLTPIDDQ